MKVYYLDVEPSAMQTSFEADTAHVYTVCLDGIKFGPFKYVNEMEVPPRANPANDPSSVFVTCENDRINVHFTNKGAYGGVVLVEEDDLDEDISNLAVLLNSISGKLDTANSKLAEIATNTGRIQ